MSAPGLPFALPERPAVTRIRQVDPASLRSQSGTRTQPMAGFEPRFVDIVDYIVRITDEIWMDRAIGYIYETYDHACTIYSSYGIVRSIEEVIAGTVQTLNAFPDGEIHHLNVAWSGDETKGFYTSHLGHSRSTNVGRTGFGPGTGRRASIRFAADCVSRDNRIFLEWLVRDNGALVRQLGFDLHETARKLAAAPLTETMIVSPETRLEGQVPRQALDMPADTIEGWAHHLFHDLWNLRRLDRAGHYYADDVIVHAGGGRVAQGLRNLQTLLIHIQAALPDAILRVENVCHSEEADGVIVAVRWMAEGTTRAGGMLGECPEGKPVFVMGISHLRFDAAGKVIEEWMLFDELGVLTQAYRA
jgi:predicted ester cyclase